jgi:hypothetical protein
VGEGWLLLGSDSSDRQQEEDDYRCFLLKHVDNNDVSPFLLHIDR